MSADLPAAAITAAAREAIARCLADVEGFPEPEHYALADDVLLALRNAGAALPALTAPAAAQAAADERERVLASTDGTIAEAYLGGRTGNSTRMVSEDGVNFRPESDARDVAWQTWHDNAIEPYLASNEDINSVSHEAFCAGWEASASHTAADERERVLASTDGTIAEAYLGGRQDERAKLTAAIRDRLSRPYTSRDILDLLGGTADSAHTPGGTT